MTKQEILNYLDNVLHPIVSPDNWNVYSELYDMIEELPSAEPVRHGKWIRVSPAKIYECSECGQNVCTGDIECYRFCHQCGARMDDHD